MVERNTTVDRNSISRERKSCISAIGVCEADESGSDLIVPDKASELTAHCHWRRADYSPQTTPTETEDRLSSGRYHQQSGWRLVGYNGKLTGPERAIAERITYSSAPMRVSNTKESRSIYPPPVFVNIAVCSPIPSWEEPPRNWSKTALDAVALPLKTVSPSTLRE